MQMMAQQMYQTQTQQQQQQQIQIQQNGASQEGAWPQIDAWRSTVGPTDLQPTLDPRSLPGQEQSETATWSQSQLHQQQIAQLQAHRAQLTPLNTSGMPATVPAPPSQFSPTTTAFYQSLGILPPSASQLPGTSSAPFYSTTFQNIPQNLFPQTAHLGGGFLNALDGMGPRRRSFAEGTHPAAGAGTPGYGVEFTGAQSRPTANHRRGAKSEDLSAQGWGLGQGGST